MSNASDFVIENDVLKKYIGPGGDVIIPDGITAIGKEAFSQCSNLTGIILPNCVRSIGAWAFYACENLAGTVNLDNVTNIGDRAFSNCSSLTDIILSENLSNIGMWAFASCKNLAQITIPDCGPSIGQGAFQDCEKLADSDGMIIINNTLRGYLGSGGDVIIPDGVVEIERMVFNGAPVKKIPKKPTAKDCTVLANYMLLFSQMASLNVLQQLYKELKTFKTAAKVLPTLEADATLMSKLNGSAENLQ